MEYNKERFKKVFFEFNNEYSYDFFIDIINWNHMDRPAPIMEQARVPGGNKDIFFSEGTYENKVIDIECYIDIRHDIKRKDIHIKRIKQWLNLDYKYRELKFSDDEGYYEAICVSNMVIDEVVEGLYRTIISFSCNPYKLKASKTYSLKSGETIYDTNEGTVIAPFKLKLKFPINSTMPDFSIVIIQKDETSTSVLNTYTYYKYSGPPEKTTEVEILSSDYKIIGKNANQEKSNITNISKGYEFPYAPLGKFGIRLTIDEECQEGHKPTLEATFIEMEI